MAQLDPVKLLMLAVLDRAVNDFRTYAAVPTGRGRRLFADVAAWFRSSTDGAFDFETICHATGLDPDFIRKGLRFSYGGACRQTLIRMAPISEIAVASARHPRPDGRFRGRRAAMRGHAFAGATAVERRERTPAVAKPVPSRVAVERPFERLPLPARHARAPVVRRRA